VNLIDDRVNKRFCSPNGVGSEPTRADKHFGQGTGGKDDVVAGSSRLFERSSGAGVMRVLWVEHAQNHACVYDY
jgi:hypothetical protein